MYMTVLIISPYIPWPCLSLYSHVVYQLIQELVGHDNREYPRNIVTWQCRYISLYPPCASTFRDMASNYQNTETPYPAGSLLGIIGSKKGEVLAKQDYIDTGCLSCDRNSDESYRVT